MREVRAGSIRRSLGAKPFEPFQGPERMIEGGDTGRRVFEALCREADERRGTVRSAPSRSEREAGRIGEAVVGGKPVLATRLRSRGLNQAAWSRPMVAIGAFGGWPPRSRAGRRSAANGLGYLGYPY